MTREPRRIFLLPAIGGDEPGLANLRSELADRAEFVMIDHPDVDRRSSEIRDFNGIVASAAERISLTQPSGKINIAGYSFGAQVAFAAACRLQQEGRAVELLALFDSRALSLLLPAPRTAKRAKTSASFVLAADIATRLLIAGGLSEPLRRAIRPVGMIFGSAASNGLRRLLLQNLRGRALNGQINGYFDGALVLFRAREQRLEGLPLDLGWSTHCKSVRSVELSGGHSSLFETNHLHKNAKLIWTAIGDRVSGDS